MMRAIALSVVLLVGCLSDARADAIAGSQRDVQGWNLAAFEGKGRGFSHCGISVAYRNGITLYFVMFASRVRSIGWSREAWNFGAGQRVPLQVHVDDASAHNVTAIAQSRSLLVAELPTGSPLFDQVRRGNQMTVVAPGGSRIGFSLDGTSVALSELAACVDRYIGVAAAPRPAPSAGSAPNATPAPVTPGPAAAPITEAADVSLTEAQVRAEIIGKNVIHLDRYHRTYGDDGTAAGGDGRFGWMGTYRLEKDGRVCLKAQGDTICFQYFRRNGQLRVRRTDPGYSGDIGPVTVEALR